MEQMSESERPGAPAQGAVAAPEIFIVDKDTVPCDGGDGALGHPRVFLTLGEDGKAVCGYCDRIYVRAGSEAEKALKAGG